MIRNILAIGMIAAAIAAPASATSTLTANFNTAGTNVASVNNMSLPGFTLTVSGVFYNLATPTSLAAFGSPTAADLTRGTRGLGIVAGGDGPQMDTNSVARREMFLLTGSKYFNLNGLTLTNVDANDTFHVYGVNANGSLVSFNRGTGTSAAAGTPAQLAARRAAGTILGGADSSLTGLSTSANDGGTATFGTGITQYFTRYLLTTRVGGEGLYLGDGGQGYSLRAVTATVPEPSSWAMMLTGFGLIGFARRRRNAALAA